MPVTTLKMRNLTKMKPKKIPIVTNLPGSKTHQSNNSKKATALRNFSAKNKYPITKRLLPSCIATQSRLRLIRSTSTKRVAIRLAV